MSLETAAYFYTCTYERTVYNFMLRWFAYEKWKKGFITSGPDHNLPIYFTNWALITGLTDEEVLINSMIFMVAGYDTTATTLCWLAYDLALNPEIQEKVFVEINTSIGQVIA